MSGSVLDEIDKTILKELVKNARITYRELAKSVKLTDVAVIKRVKKLEKNSVIKRYTVIINPLALGFTKISFTGINVKPERLFDVVRLLKEKEYVKYLALTTGDHDIVATIWARSAEELEKIHDEIRNFEGVVSVYPMIISEVIKDEIYI